MIKQLLDQELPQIQRGARAAQPGYEPLISYVVVIKRHHTRFFLPAALGWSEKDIGVMDPLDYNIKQGTVVDSEVCDTQKFDFYMMSHKPLHRATPRPTHYHVIHDDATFT